MGLYESTTLLPNYPPAECNYQWAKYQIPQETWVNFGVEQYGINAVFFTPNVAVANQCIANQLKQQIEFERSFFYIFGVSEKTKKDYTTITPIEHEDRVWGFLQLGKFRGYEARDKMYFNLRALLALFKAQNKWIQSYEVQDTNFEERSSNDGDFLAEHTAFVRVSGRTNPVYACK